MCAERRPHGSEPANDGLRSALAAGLDDPSSPAVARLAAHVAAAFGAGTLAVVHYGSHAHGRGGAGSDPRPESAQDFVVVVARYRAAYEAAVASGAGRYRAGVATALAHLLPPNVVAVADRAAEPPWLAKCVVISLGDLARACGPRAHDHMLRARLFQQVRVAWARDAAARRAVADAIVAARAGTFRWARAQLPPAFDAEAYCRALFDASFAAEIRPEGAARVALLLGTQAELLVPMYAALLADIARRGVLAPAGVGCYRDPRPPGRVARARSALYFRRSKLRATLRWAKYAALFDDWLDYVVQKVARRSGTVIMLTPRERRWPFIFLWPKAIRYLRARPQRRAADRHAGPHAGRAS